MNIKKHVIDKTIANRGVWLSYDKAEFLIASSKTANHLAAAAGKVRLHSQSELKAKPQLYNEITVEVMAEKVLLDWRGVNDGTNELPYSKANALDLLNNAPDFKEWVSEEAAKIENFRAEAVAEDAAAVKSRPEVADDL